jgi:hypothetical protein
MHWPVAIVLLPYSMVALLPLPAERKAPRTNVSHNASNRHGEDIIRVMSFAPGHRMQAVTAPLHRAFP